MMKQNIHVLLIAIVSKFKLLMLISLFNFLSWEIEKFVHWGYKLIPSLQDFKNLSVCTQDEFSHKKVEVKGPGLSPNPMKSIMYLIYTNNRILNLSIVWSDILMNGESGLNDPVLRSKIIYPYTLSWKQNQTHLTNHPSAENSLTCEIERSKGLESKWTGHLSWK